MVEFGSSLNKNDVEIKTGPVVSKVPLAARILFRIPDWCLIAFAVNLMLTSGCIYYLQVTSVLKSIKTGLKKEAIPSLLESADYTLVATTIFVIGLSLLSVSFKVRTTQYVCIDDFKSFWEQIVENIYLLLKDFIDAMKEIDRLILSMTVITLFLTFLIYILRKKYNTIGSDVIYLGFSIAVAILAITIYLYVAHKTE